MPYVSPGDAFSDAFQQTMLESDRARRQQMLDSITAARERRLAEHDQVEMEQAKATLEEKRREADERMDEKKQNAFEKRVHDMLPGDIPDADLIAADKKYGTGYFVQDAATGHHVYTGNRQDREKKLLDDKVKVILGKIQNVQPGSPEFKKLATEYEMTAGKSLPASLFAAPKADGIPIVRESPDRKVVERLQGGQWVPVTGDAPAGSHFVPAPAPKDTSAKEARDASQLEKVHQEAVTELDKWAQPVLTQLQAIRDLGTVINQMTPQADALVAPLVLKSTVSGTGSGFRMTRPEIENVVGGRSKWESLEAALNKWNTDPTKALSITDEQRKQLRDLVKAIRTKATKVSRQIVDARHAIDDAEDTKTINKARTSLQEALMAMDEDNDQAVGWTPPSFAKPVGKK